MALIAIRRCRCVANGSMLADFWCVRHTKPNSLYGHKTKMLLFFYIFLSCFCGRWFHCVCVSRFVLLTSLR